MSDQDYENTIWRLDKRIAELEAEVEWLGRERDKQNMAAHNNALKVAELEAQLFQTQRLYREQVDFAQSLVQDLKRLQGGVRG